MAHQNPQPEPGLQHGWTDHEKALAGVDSGELAAWLVDLIDVRVFYQTHPAAPRPRRTVMNIRIPAGSDEDRHAAVDAVAEDLGVHTETTPDGCYMAARHFGGVTVEAHYTPAAAQVQNHQRFLHGKAA